MLHRRSTLPFHPNGMTFAGFDADGAELDHRTYYSVGGGFVVDETRPAAPPRRGRPDAGRRTRSPPARSCWRTARASGLPVSGIMMANELSWRTEEEVRAGLLHIWSVMQECVATGCEATGVLPGGLKVPPPGGGAAREPGGRDDGGDPLRVMDWVDLYALAVNEENAAGGRVVTAPTNGAAGIIPAVLHYYARFVPGADDDGVVRFLLTAAAIGVLFKENASISRRRGGLPGRGRLGLLDGGRRPRARSWAARPSRSENAAEIGIEHNLGLTCDPVGGLVQIPCIERNAVASVKAITAARLALYGDGSHHVVASTRRSRPCARPGADMKVKYKETVARRPRRQRRSSAEGSWAAELRPARGRGVAQPADCGWWR